MNGSNLLKEIGRSFIVSSLIPASVFVLLTGVIFRDFFPYVLLSRLQGENKLFGLATLGLITLWIAFALYSGQDHIFKFFEGYSCLLPFRNILTWFEIHWFHEHQKIIDYYFELEDKESKEAYFPYVRAAMQDLELQMPLDIENILPTRLGNILRASEVYPYDRYGIDALTMWPRLVNFLPEEFNHELEEINNNLVFMLNSSLLFLILALSSVFVVILNILRSLRVDLVTFIWQINQWEKAMRHLPLGTFCLIGGICIVFGVFFYHMGTSVAIEYGYYVRTAYDLYRHKLFDYIVQNTPENEDRAKLTWKEIGDFYVLGNTFGDREIKISNNKKKTRNSPTLWFCSGLITGLLLKILRENKAGKKFVYPK